MRLASLFVLAILLPVVVLLPFGSPAAGAALININTANTTLLDTLPGIGPSKATAIVEYRNAHGPFATIADIQNVSGIGPSTYADIAPLITVGDPTPPPATPSTEASTTPVTSTSTTATVISSTVGGPTEYLPIPKLRIVSAGDRTVSAGADTTFSAVVYDSKGNKRSDALITWSFGDGMRRVGASVLHVYYEPGEYLAVIRATTPDGGDVSEEMVVTVKDAKIKIASISPSGINLMNNSSIVANLSFWRLKMGGQEFKIPEDTQILPGHIVLFHSRVIQLPLSDSASLLYPNGDIADTYPAIATITVVQPLISSGSYEKVQAVTPPTVKSEKTITRTNVQKNDEAVIAPTDATKLAAVGATLPVASDSPKTGGILKSPWTLGLLGVIVLAGAAFILI